MSSFLAVCILASGYSTKKIPGFFGCLKAVPHPYRTREKVLPTLVTDFSDERKALPASSLVWHSKEQQLPRLIVKQLYSHPRRLTYHALLEEEILI